MRVIFKVTVFVMCWCGEMLPADCGFRIRSILPWGARHGIRGLPRGGTLGDCGVWTFSQPSGCSGAALSPAGIPGGSSGCSQG